MKTTVNSGTPGLPGSPAGRGPELRALRPRRMMVSAGRLRGRWSL